MAQAEQPERLRAEHQVTVDDIRQLMGASTRTSRCSCATGSAG